MSRLLHILISLLLCCSFSASAQNIKLFSAEMRNAVSKQQVSVMDFLERYFGDISASKRFELLTKMEEDKVYFRKGQVEEVAQIKDDMPFTMNLHDNYYEVSWEKQGQPFVTIAFPAQYELIWGKNQIEVQNSLKDSILSSPNHTLMKQLPQHLSQIADNIYMEMSESYEIDNLNDAAYYKKANNDYQPLFENNYLEFSVANLFRGLIADADYQLSIEQSVYGLKTVNYSLPLSQWLNYCADQNLKVYYGVEEQIDEALKVVVLAHSQEFGYNHLLSVQVPNGLVENKDAVFRVRLTPYIPTHNIKDLFKKQTVKTKQKTWE